VKIRADRRVIGWQAKIQVSSVISNHWRGGATESVASSNRRS